MGWCVQGPAACVFHSQAIQGWCGVSAVLLPNPTLERSRGGQNSVGVFYLQAFCTGCPALRAGPAALVLYNDDARSGHVPGALFL